MTENELKTLLKTVTPPNKAARAAAHPLKPHLPNPWAVWAGWKRWWRMPPP